MQDIEVQPEAPHRVRQQGLVDAGAGEGEAKQVVAPVPARVCASFARTRSSTPRGSSCDHVADQRARDFMLRLAEDVDHAAMLDHAAGVHHRHAVADRLDHFHLVGDQHDGETQFAVDPAQQSRIERVVSGSSAEVASSDSSTLGWLASARAMPTRCFWPPLICAG